ncbi:hypothetical protein [Desulfopila inferna]|uniref:hypothetical protein n=1 Tax=Desulfopila inferna TaxID=468528 RepID=UPI001964A025|nr:hypothetical protein [Desulfopila inferna]MBM9606257.1 hypothetical protein [Desulfopila inferna]
MSDYSNPIDTTTHTKDGITYRIELFIDENNNYYGRWTCNKNNQTGNSNSSKSSKEQVITDNKINIDAYHFNTFGTKPLG